MNRKNSQMLRTDDTNLFICSFEADSLQSANDQDASRTNAYAKGLPTLPPLVQIPKQIYYNNFITIQKNQFDLERKSSEGKKQKVSSLALAADLIVITRKTMFCAVILLNLSEVHF